MNSQTHEDFSYLLTRPRLRAAVLPLGAKIGASGVVAVMLFAACVVQAGYMA